METVKPVSYELLVSDIQSTIKHLYELKMECLKIGTDKINTIKSQYVDDKISKLNELKEEFVDKNVDKINEMKEEYINTGFNKLNELKQELVDNNLHKLSELKDDFVDSNLHKLSELKDEYTPFITNVVNLIRENPVFGLFFIRPAVYVTDIMTTLDIVSSLERIGFDVATYSSYTDTKLKEKAINDFLDKTAKTVYDKYISGYLSSDKKA
jgi:hypothetical protein